MPSPVSLHCPRHLPKPSKCQPPISGISNGVITSGKTELGFACNPGFRLVGSSHLKCQNKSVWSDKPPICSKTVCPDLKHLDSSVTVHFIPGEAGYKAVFSCKDSDRAEFENGGKKDLLCRSASGSWSSEVTPKCVVRRCSVPPSVKGAVFKSQLDSLDIGQKIHLECDEGYEALEAGNDIVLECKGPDGVWIGLPENADSICKVKTCKIDQDRLRSEHNGKWSVAYAGESNKVSAIGGDSDVLELFPNETLELSCDQGFVLERNVHSWTCGPNGDGLSSRHHLPKCLEQHCQSPDYLPNGRFSAQGLYLGAEVVYTCKSGYEFKVRSCKKNP